MKISHFVWLILFLGGWAFSQISSADTSDILSISGSANVTDGDTIKIGNTRIRLIGIDACERGQTAIQDGQIFDCYESSKDHLNSLVGGSVVNCEYENEDRYHRPLAICKIGDLNLNAEMIRAGEAVIYRYRGRATYPELEPLEEIAKAKNIGIWAADVFEDPAIFRRRKRSK